MVYPYGIWVYGVTMALPDRLKKLFPTHDEYMRSMESQVVEYFKKFPTSTRKHIAAKFKIKAPLVSSICKKHGLKFNGPRVLPAVREERLRLYYLGWSMYKISKHLQICPKAISKWMRLELGKDFRLNGKDRVPRSEDNACVD